MKKILLFVLVIILGIGFSGCSLSPNEELNKIDLKNVYNECECQSPWAKLGSDNSYIYLDTNPYDFDDESYLSRLYRNDVYNAIDNINSKLGIPSSVKQDMLHTNSLAGRQRRTYESLGIEVSWTYHPDYGLQVTYSIYIN